MPDKQKLKNIFYTLFFILLTFLILTHSRRSLYYALTGLNLWFTKMIPTLLPFMILSGIMVRLKLTENIASIIHPVIAPIWRVNKNVTYGMLMGFLCGFPMGARVTCDLLSRNMITRKEADFLLAFCNNIGPVYFVGFVMSTLQRKLFWPYLFGMYGLPLLYGLFLRYTVFQDMTVGIHVRELRACTSANKPLHLLEQIDESINAGIQSILMLGGYMIFFNLLNLVPDVCIKLLSSQEGFAFLNRLPSAIAPILEITGGIGMLGDSMPILVLLLLPFGGLSCIAQTYSIIRHSGLSIYNYIRHKLILTAITLGYYMLWHLLFRESFLL